MIIKMIEIYNIAAQRCWWTHAYCIETIALHAPLTILSSTLCYQLCYVAVQINNCLKRIFVIKVATMKITDDLMEAITCLPQNRHFSWWTKMNGTQRRAMLSPWRMHCMYSGMAKGTSWAEATLSSKKNQAHSLSHCWVTQVWKSGRQLIS